MISFRTASTLLATATVSLAPVAIAASALTVGSVMYAPAANAASLGSCASNIGPLVGDGGVGASGFVGADDCQKSLAGNDNLADVTSIFGAGWTRAFKTESPLTNTPSGELFTQGNLALTYTGGASSSLTGTWTLSGLAPQVQSFILAVKAGNGNRPNAQSLLYYQFNDLSVLSGDWSTFGLLNNGNNQPELSHITVYTSNAGTTPIPTPALLPGLIGMGVAAMRKRKGEAEESAEA